MNYIAFITIFLKPERQ